MKTILFCLAIAGCGDAPASPSTVNFVKDNPVKICTSSTDCPPGQVCKVDPQSNSMPPGQICAK